MLLCIVGVNHAERLAGFNSFGPQTLAAKKSLLALEVGSGFRV